MGQTEGRPKWKRAPSGGESGTSFIDTALLIASVTVTVAFFAYGFNIFYMLRLSKRYVRPVPRDGRRPAVAIHLPVYNEKYVVERLLRACIAMADDYGREKVHVSVLDDSDDETTLEVEGLVKEYGERGYTVDVLHREDRRGFKAGALNAALEKASEEFIVVFDSDFLPKPDFLRKAVGYITADDRMGMVQFRWSYLNREYNWITRAVSIGMDAHFLIEQPGRDAGGLFLNFNGSAGIVRTKALRECGGWQSDTLAEDLDASYRMQMRHYRIRFVNDEVPCEVPPTVISFKRQQGRWARGSLQVAKKSLPELLRMQDVTLRQKFEASVHLTYYLVHPLMFASFLLASLAAIFDVKSITVALLAPEQIGSIGREGMSALTFVSPLWAVFGVSILLCTAAAWVYYIVAMRRQGMGVLRNVTHLLALGFIGYGISVSNTLEAAKALLLKDSGVFKRTPKYAVVGREGSWRDKKYQVPIDWAAVAEALCIVLAAVAMLRAVHFANYGILMILGVYAVSYSFVLVTSTRQSGRETRHEIGMPSY